jgi:predicted dienelactone hydrolase
MRPLEIALWAVTASLLLWHLAHREAPDWVCALAAAALVLLVAQVLAEGARWHIAPAYLVALYLFVAGAWPHAPAPRTWTVLTGVGLLVAAAALGALFPVFQLPRPTGRHPIGTVTLHLVDPARNDPRTDRADGRRELMVQVWYPAERDGPARPYRALAETTLKTQHLARVRTHAAGGVPVAASPARHPLVLFSPSTGGRRNHNTAHAEELASHGFVVVGIDHPFDTDLVVLPDGRTARGSDTTPGAAPATADERLRIRLADVRFVLDEVERLDRSDPTGLFTGRVEVSRIGVFGHSFGGAVAAEACRADPRVAAGVNFDGSIHGESARQGIGKPFLFFAEDVPLPTPEAVAAATGAAREELLATAKDLATIRRGLAGANGHWVTVRGTRHVNYCDTPLYSPLWRMLRAGPIRPERAAEIVSAYLRSFFRKHLTGDDDGLLDRTTPPYPEVEVERVPNAER